MKTRFVCKICKQPCFLDVETTTEGPDTPDRCMFAHNPRKAEWVREQEQKPKEPKNTLPKLTAEVFDRPDCPAWAMFAAVSKFGCLTFFEEKPVLGNNSFLPLSENHTTELYRNEPGRWDASDWKNSLIHRPEPEQKAMEDLAAEIVCEFKRTMKNKAAPVAQEILRELERAKEKHPHFPLGLIEQVAIMAEEAGEAIREANRIRWNEGGTFAALRAELIQTATMCVRVIENLGDDAE